MRTYFGKAVIALSAMLLALPAFAEEGGYERDPAAGWDHLWTEIIIDITVIGVIFSIAAIYMVWKYRAKSEDEVGTAPKLSKAAAIAWVLIPASLFMADDFFLSAKGWTLWNDYRRIPDEAQEIRVTAYQWYWEFDYGDELVAEELVVKKGQPIVLRMTSEDVLHSLYIPEFRVKEDVMPGRVTYVWFNPKETGEFVHTCTEYCGTAHAEMYTNVRVVEEAEYDQFINQLKEEAKADSKAQNPQS
ncbi:Cytochrome c oxidase aa3, subunit II [Candidatus Terasakiella magnetica]|uniref:cytochrome-c oxidase n=1 Tax=Candidatus Terasakiella magnetica TaxID=1867952 RepID=A0A1C3RC66_9PROT|nr:cytochrome c oxidase subunit II [Candidatus Terasakiella magnetica]SCA54873.1 Cytochrome c oxidase aa3, subunit II [Candidatus Terasakiella magnetica]